MKARTKNDTIARDPGDADPQDRLLDAIACAMACSIRLGSASLGPRDDYEASQMLAGVYSLFALAQSQEAPHSLELIESLGDLHGLVAGLREKYPDAISRIGRVERPEGCVHYYACPF
jgi:hypothetical protein